MVLLCLVGSAGVVARPQGETPSTESVTGLPAELFEVPERPLEWAPHELAQLTGKDVLIAMGDRGRELFVYDPAGQELSVFDEEGRRWGDAIVLQNLDLSSLPTLINMDVDGNRVFLSGSSDLFIFSTDGEPVWHQRLFQASDVTVLSEDRWAVALTNVPHPTKPGHFLARDAFGDEVPRVVVYDDAGEVLEVGLIEDGEVSVNTSVGRALRLTSDRKRLFAAERASYTLLSLDRKLRAQAMYRDPEMDGEEAPSDQVTVEDAGPDGAEVSAMAAPRSRDLSRPEADSEKAKRIDVRFEPVITDIDWGSEPSALYVLLDRESYHDRFHIDVVDVAQGRVRRTALRLPDEVASLKLKQLTVGRKYVWLRGYPADTPILCFERSVLDEGLEKVVPQVEPAFE